MIEKHSKEAGSIAETTLGEISYRAVSADQERKSQDKSSASLMSPFALMALGLAGAANAGVPSERSDPTPHGKKSGSPDQAPVAADPSSVPVARDELMSEQAEAALAGNLQQAAAVTANTTGDVFASLPEMDQLVPLSDSAQGADPSLAPAGESVAPTEGEGSVLGAAAGGETLAPTGISDVSPPIILAAASEAAVGAGAEVGAGAAAAATGVTAGAVLAIIGGVLVLGAAAGVGSSDSDDVVPPAPAPSSSGVVIDGLLAGATVFRDMDGDRILDAGESSTTSSLVDGSFVLPGTGGVIVATGGNDLSTGLAFRGQLTAPDGSTVVTPLTTLLVASNGALTATELKTALGLTTDPLTFNPFATSATPAAALEAQQAIAQVENVLLRTGELMVAAGSATNLNAAFTTVAASFATFADGRTGVDLANPTTLNAFFDDVSSGGANLLSATDQVAAVQYLDAVNSDIDAATNLASANLSQSLVDTTLNANGYARVVSAHTIQGFAGTAASGNSVQITEGATVLGTGTVGADGRFSITTTSPLAAGTHTLTVTETRTSGTPPTVTTVATASLTATVDVTVAVPTLALATDSGTAGDSITNVGTVNVSGLETGATWAYSTNAGTSFTPATGTSFALTSDGVKSVIVRQTDLAGNTADSAALGFTLDTTASAPTLALASDTGASASDRITRVDTVNVSGLETGAAWEYSTNGGTSYLAGTGTSFPLTGDGAKSVIVRQTDVAGNTSAASAAFDFTLDTTAILPTLTLATDGGTAGDGLTNVGTVNVSGLETGATWEYSTDAGTIFTAGTGTSFPLTGDGAKSVIVRQTDVAGNTSATSAALAFVLDTSAPAFTPSSPVDGGLTLGLAANLVLSASETVAKGTGTLSLYKSDNTLVEAINVTSSQVTISGTSNATQISINPTADLINGQGYYILASAGALVDTAGNAWAGITNAATWNFTGAGATVTIAAVAGDNTVNLTESGSTITVTGTLAAEAGVLAAYTLGDMSASLQPAAGGTPITLTPVSYTGSTGAWSATIPASALSGTADYTLTVRFDGTSGLAAGVSGFATSTVHVDTVVTPPTLALGTDSGSGGDSITNLGTVNVSGLEAGATWAYSTDAGANFTPGTGTSFTLTEDGGKSVIVRQTDVASNTSAASAALAFTLDTSAPGAPTLALASDTGTSVGDGITNVGTVNVTGLETGATWEYNAGTGFTAGTGTSFALTVDGVKSVIVRQTDVAGNTGAVSAAFVFTLDGTANAPTLALASDTGTSTSDGLTNNGAVNVSVEAGATWEYSTDGGTNFTPGTGSSFTLGAGSYAANAIQARQTDVAGNASTAGAIASAVTVDATAPTLTVSDNGGASTGMFTYNFAFSEAVTGFDANDVAVVNGTKGTFSTTNASTYSLLVTPTTSTTAQSMTVDVAGSAATDTAGNASSAAAQVLHSVLYGTSGADTLNLGPLADTVFLGAGSDVVKMTSAALSTATALDKVFDFAAGDKLDLSAILGSGGSGYSSSVLPDTGAGFVELKNLTLTQGTSTTTVRFDINFDAASVLSSKITGAVIDLAYNSSVVSAAQAVSTQFTDPTFGSTTPVWSNVVSNLTGTSGNGKIALTADFNTANPIIDANGKVLGVTLIVNSLVSTFQVGLEAGAAGSNTYVTTANNVTHDVIVGITKTAGVTAGTAGVLEIVADTGTLGAGDNQLHMLTSFVSEHNLTHLQLSYDTNPAIGTTTASSLISMDFVGDVTANLIPANLIYI